MKEKRIGNDINVRWQVFQGDMPFMLEGKDVKLYLRTPYAKVKARDYIIVGNEVRWTFYGKDQTNIGKYSLVLVVNEDKEGMVTTDACDFVKLVACSCKTGGMDDKNVTTESIELISHIDFGEGGSGIKQTMTPVMYNELVQLRNDGQLIPGTYYRIMDYETTTVQADTQSAGNLFDVVVLALSENELSEQAHAVHSERDTEGYFADSNLSAWQIWYCLENDTTRFAWADAENGKGVIYRMIDEFDNDCPYDFKNVQYKRRINIEEGYPQFSEDAEETWVYTFCANSYHINNDEWSELKDGSLESPYGHMSDEETSTFHHNVMKPWIVIYDYDDVRENCGKAYLNGNIFLGWWEEIGSANEEDAPFYYAYCCYMNSLGFGCRLNSFGCRCKWNSLGIGCDSNSFGNNSPSNSFGDNCNKNSFGTQCCSNSFGDNCYSNSFGNYCNSNSFGNSCGNNSFGNSCSNNSFGNECYSNHFMDDGDGNGRMPAHNVQYCVLEDNVQEMTIHVDERAGEYRYLRFVHIYRGVSKDEIFPPYGVDYESCYARKSNGNIISFVLADLKPS